MAVAQSFSKNAGLYGERLGALHIPCASPDTAAKVKSQLVSLIRREFSSPTKYAADLVSIVCEDPDLFAGWMADISTMSRRISDMRVELVRALEALGTPGDWHHVVRQRGMFA
jgi:aspartate aminotransferase